MKKAITLFTVLFLATFTVQAQDAMKDHKMSKEISKVITLQQTPGEFTQKQITVSAGTYVFEIDNRAGKDVGFVLVPKGKDVSNPENHIKTAYVTEVVKNNNTGNSNPTTLTKGEYVYFCPLNKTTTDNTLVVQ